MKRIVAGIATGLLLCSCTNSMRSGGQWKTGTYKRKTDIRFNGVSRSYLLHVPARMPEDQWPLVVVLHGAFSTAKEMELQSGFSNLADEQGFCVAYPNGIGLFGKLQHWNAGHCCGKAAKDKVDDVAFINAVIEDAASVCPVDTSRIFMVGYSNGGMMAYRYAAEQANRLAAAAVFAGAIDSDADGKANHWTPPQPRHPLPILILHGTADDIVPPSGGKSPARSDGPTYASVDTARTLWEASNGNQAEVRVELLEGWNHRWPGLFFTTGDGIPEAMQGYDAAEVIWDFFQRQ